VFDTLLAENTVSIRPVMIRLFVSLLLLGLLPLSARDLVPQGRDLYMKWCASCHGAQHEGGLGGSLVEGEFKQVGKTIGFVEYVKQGNLSAGMPAFGDGLNDDQILSIAHYVADVRQQGGVDSAQVPVANEAGTGDHSFRVEDVFELDGTPWAIRFFPDGTGGLITRREGTLHRFDWDGNVEEIRGTPEAFVGGQGGMMEVALHPNYSQNAWVYLAYSHKPKGQRSSMTRIVRGQVHGTQWSREEVIYEAPAETYMNSRKHWGVRVVFQDGYLYFGIGDRGTRDDAQDLSKPNGKIHRLHDDGRVPDDNPFVNERDALPSIWAYGVRNPQGLDLHPITGALWESEHGPRGGDEINLIEGGKNYGWPEITYGVNYSGTKITNRTEAPGMEQPKHQWTPSIAVCGMDFYEGDVFPNWNVNLFAGGLASEELYRLIIQDGEVVESEIILENEGRIRDVETGPDGLLYLVLNRPDKVVRLVPKN